MNSINIKDSEKYEEIISRFEDKIQKIKDIFENENNNFERIGSDGFWKGSTSEAIVEKYNALKGNYEDIINALNTYLIFMKKTLSGYKNLEQKLNSRLDVSNNEFDVV